MAVTIAYDKSVQGWTSEYTFIPDSAVSLNNNFYTFKNGRIWRHNIEGSRNTFYGIQASTEVTIIFNDAPSDVKNFKTIGYEGVGGGTVSVIEVDVVLGDPNIAPGVVAVLSEEEKYQNISDVVQLRVSPFSNFDRPEIWERVGEGYSDVQDIGSAGWDVTVETNRESGQIPASFFLQKEGKSYAWIRGEDNNFNPDFASGNVKGIGASSGVGNAAVAVDATKTFTTPGNSSSADLIFEPTVPYQNFQPGDVFAKVSDIQASMESASEDITFYEIQDVDPANNEITLTAAANVEEGDYQVFTLGRRAIFDSNIPNNVTRGDLIYSIESNGGQFDRVPVLVGRVSDKFKNIITTDLVEVPASTNTATPVQGDFFLYVKNNEVNKSGVIGFYAIVTLINNSPDMSELFSVDTSVFTSTN